MKVLSCSAWLNGFVLLLLLGSTSRTSAQETGEKIPLWKAGAPGFEDKRDIPELAESYWVKNIHNPSVAAFFPPADKATGAAVIICPGGGHRELVFNAEGVEAAKYLNSIGVAAFALKYRLGREPDLPYTIQEHGLADGQRAVRLVRSRAAEWGIDPDRIGMLGFSAGGEIVSMVAYADPKSDDPKDEVDEVSVRLDFQALVYPGPVGIPETVPADAPPAFLLVANDDFGAAQSIATLFPKLRNSGVPMELHILARGGHAFNMGNRSNLKSVRNWPELLKNWMDDNFILDTSGREEFREQWKKQQARMKERRARGGQ